MSVLLLMAAIRALRNYRLSLVYRKHGSRGVELHSWASSPNGYQNVSTTKEEQINFFPHTLKEVVGKVRGSLPNKLSGLWLPAVRLKLVSKAYCFPRFA